MNRKLLSVLIASTVAIPLAATAETTLYGRLDLALENRDFDSYTVTNGDKGDKTKAADGWDMKNQSSRIGVKGSEDLGSGLKAVFQCIHQAVIFQVVHSTMTGTGCFLLHLFP